jgi:hypothetical protein
VAEGAPLLREYTLIGIEGSNPSLSAKLMVSLDLFLLDLARAKKSV